METKGKMFRGVVVFDIEIEGGLKAAMDFQTALNEFSTSFAKSYKSSSLKITKVQAEVPLQERRGATGDLNDIVFRGTRGFNISDDLVKLKDLSPLHRRETRMIMTQHARREGMELKEYQQALAAGDTKVSLDEIIQKAQDKILDVEVGSVDFRRSLSKT
jgi:hypothetical protein